MCAVFNKNLSNIGKVIYSDGIRLLSQVVMLLKKDVAIELSILSFSAFGAIYGATRCFGVALPMVEQVHCVR
jgi:hypothetical protein